MSDEISPFAGLDIDVEALGIEARLLFELGSEVAGIRAEWAKYLKLQVEYEKRGPVTVQMNRDGTVDANGDPEWIDLGGPAYGRVWEVRRLVTGGLTWATTAAGTALAVVSSTPLRRQVPNIANVRDEATSLPLPAFYGAGQFSVRNPDHVFIVIIGGTAGQQYVANGSAFDSPDVPDSSVFTI